MNRKEREDITGLRDIFQKLKQPQRFIFKEIKSLLVTFSNHFFSDQKQYLLTILFFHT